MFIIPLEVQKKLVADARAIGDTAALLSVESEEIAAKIEQQAEKLAQAIEKAIGDLDRAYYQHPEDRPGI